MDGAALVNGAERFREAVIARAPGVLTGLGMLVGGWIVARLVRSGVQRALTSARLDARLEGTRVHSLIGALGPTWSAAKLVAQLVYVTVLLLTVDAAAGYWGLTGVQEALASAVGYLPKALSALALFAGGTYLAGLAKRSVGAVLRELRNPAAGVLEALTEGGLLLVVTLVALDMLGVNLTFITSNLTLVFGAVLVIVVFLGCWAMRAPAEELVANYYLRRLLSVGDQVETKAHRGTVLEFVPLGLVLREPSGDEQFVPARELISGLRRRQAIKPDSPAT
jgi:hypothetical protein